MNSLNELNSYSNTGVFHADERGYIITFSVDNPSPQTININEGSTHKPPVATDITLLTSAPASLTYTIDLSQLSGATLVWPELPTGVVASTPSTGVYRLTGYLGGYIWDQVKQPTISIPRDYNGTWQYTSSITYPTYNGSSGKSWVNIVNVANLAEISQPSAFTYNEDTPTTITNYPQILDVENAQGDYTVAISPSATAAVTAFTSAGSGGSTSFNSTSKVLTITGTKAEVNSHLAALTLNPGKDYVSNFTITYTLTNPMSNLISQVTQSANIGQTYLEMSDSVAMTFAEDGAAFSVTGAPKIIDLESSYRLEITANDPAALSSMSLSTITGGTASWNAASKKFTLTGTKAQINVMLNNMLMITGKDYSNNFWLNYLLTDTTSGALSLATQQFTCTSASGEISTPSPFTYDETIVMSVTGVPQITDVASGDTYTLEIYPNNVSAIDTISSTYSTSGLTSVSWDDAAKKLTIIGGKAPINTYINALTVKSTKFRANFLLNYKLTSSTSGLVTTVQQTMVLGRASLIDNILVARTYVQNGYELLFPTSVPSITGSGQYAYSISLSANIGVIGHGENLTTPYNWNATTRTYFFSGSAAECNQDLATLRLIATKSSTGNATATFALSVNGESQGSTTFQITGSALSAYISGGTASLTINEDAAFTFDAFNIKPHWSDQYSVLLRSQRSDADVNDACFIALPNNTWAVYGTYSASYGIYKNFSPAATLAEHIDNVTLPTMNAILRSDYTTAFSIKKTLSIGGTFNGTILVNGIESSSSTSVSITADSGEYTLTTAYNYTEDLEYELVSNITDIDSAGEYTVTYTQTSPANIGRWKVNGVYTPSNQPLVLTGSKATINGISVFYEPPADYIQNIAIWYKQEKTKNGTTITQANALTVSTCTATHADSAQNTVNLYYYEDTNAIVSNGNVVTDTSTNSTYTLTYTQTVPDTATQPGRFIVGNVYQTPGTPVVITGNKATVNSKSIRFEPPSDYAGTLNMSFTQVRHAPYEDITQADATLNFGLAGGNSSEYYLEPAIAYIGKGYRTPLWYRITDVDATVTSYTVEFKQVDANGTFFVSNVASEPGANIVLTGSGSTINAKDIRYEPEEGRTTPITLTMSQYKTDPIAGNVTQAVDVQTTLVRTVVGTRGARLNITSPQLKKRLDKLYGQITWNDYLENNTVLPDYQPTDSRYYVRMTTDVGEFRTVGTNAEDSDFYLYPLFGGSSAISTSLGNDVVYQSASETTVSTLINNAIYATQANTTANISLTVYQIWPRTQVVIENQTKQVTFREPALDDYANGIHWQGGQYVGDITVDGSVYNVVTYRNISTNTNANGGFNGWFAPWQSAPIPPNNSNVDGATNCINLRTLDITTASGYDYYLLEWVDEWNVKWNDWYIPSINEIILADQNNVFASDSQSPVKYTDKWSSTMIDGQVKVYDTVNNQVILKTIPTGQSYSATAPVFRRTLKD